MTDPLPDRWAWLLNEPGPRMLKQALSLFGTLEYPGAANNPDILGWAAEIDRPGQSWISDLYERRGDAVPWCGLFMGVIAQRSGKPMPNNPLRALAWADWGRPVKTPKLGDVLTFTRTGGGHVGLYVGETDDNDPMVKQPSYFVLGGNQQDAVNITRILKTRLYEARNFYKIGQPRNCRRIFMGAQGPLSENEA